MLFSLLYCSVLSDKLELIIKTTIRKEIKHDDQ